MSRTANPIEKPEPSVVRTVSPAAKKASYNHNKVRKRLRRLTGQAISDYNMIEAGDRVMVCLSGGKDSYTMLDILLHLQRSAPSDLLTVSISAATSRIKSPSVAPKRWIISWRCCGEKNLAMLLVSSN